MPETLANELSNVSAVPNPGWPGTNERLVLVVEDDTHCRETLEHELTARGFAVRSFPDAASLLVETALLARADVVLLDWMLPHMPGIELLSQLRLNGVRVPIAFLTGRALTANEHLAFDRGAADFIDKGRGFEVLFRRLRRLIEASNSECVAGGQTLQHCGELTLRPSIRRALWRGIDPALTLGEYNVVELLASNVGRSLTYREIYDRMHYAGFIAGSGDDGYQTNVRSTIKRIRTKFRLVDPGFSEIANQEGIGYCWRFPVESA